MNKFKWIREQIGLSQERISQKLSISRNTWYGWETGKFKPSQMAQERLDKYLLAQGIKVEDIPKEEK